MMAQMARAVSPTTKPAAPTAARHTTSIPSLNRRHPQALQAKGPALYQDAARRLRPLGMQGKLAVSRPSDALEQEADRVADRVVRLPDGPSRRPSLSAGTRHDQGGVQRKCAACRDDEPRQRHTKRADEDDEVKGKFTATPPVGAELDAGIEQRLRALGPGEPLASSERAFFEPRFGHDFSRVRVHAGAPAAGVAHALNARALTRGQDILFAPGQYAPGTGNGRHLLAHELAHVVQQGEQVPAGIPTGAVQRDLATPEPAVPPAAQPDLTEDQIKTAIAFNKLRFDAASTRLIQDLAGTKPTGVWTEDDIRAIAAVQEQFGLKKDGMVGDETFKFLDKEVSAEKLDRSDAHCLVSFSVFAANPVVGPVAGGRRSITVRFTMSARFPTHCRCADYEYRQFIRGHWNRERAGVVTDLGNTFANFPGGGGLPAAWTEDGNATAAALNYGHRAQTDEAINHYLDDTGAVDQANGCRYEGEDVPGGPDNVLAGDVFDIELNFRGEIRRRGRVVTSQTWTPLRGRFPVP